MKSGSTVLRAVTTQKELAHMYRDTATKERSVARAMVEESRLNHLYFGMFDKKIPNAMSVKRALAAARKDFNKEA